MRVNGFDVVDDEYPWLSDDPVFTPEERDELERSIREERILRDILDNGDSDYVMWHDRRGMHLEERHKRTWLGL